MNLIVYRLKSFDLYGLAWSAVMDNSLLADSNISNRILKSVASSVIQNIALKGYELAQVTYMFFFI